MFCINSRFLKVLLDAAKSCPDKYEDDKALILKAIASSLNVIGINSWQSRIRPQDIEVSCEVFFVFLSLLLLKNQPTLDMLVKRISLAFLPQGQ